MEEIIKIEEKDGRKAVDARELHQFLENKRQFADWIKQRVEQYGFMENKDFEVFHKSVNNSNGGRPTVEYALSIEMAKELSMAENNEKGRIARKYFIACEEKLKQGVLVMPNFSNPAEAARAWADQYEKNLALEAHNKELKEENQHLAPKGEYFDDSVEPVEKIWLSTKEFAKYIGMSTGYIHDLRKSGQIHHYMLGNTAFFKKSDVDELIEGHKVC